MRSACARGSSRSCAGWYAVRVWTCEYRGQGLLRQLVALAVDYARDAGSPRIEAYPRQSHGKARMSKPTASWLPKLQRQSLTNPER